MYLVCCGDFESDIGGECYGKVVALVETDVLAPRTPKTERLREGYGPNGVAGPTSILRCASWGRGCKGIKRNYRMSCDGCDHTITNAPDPIRTPQLSVLGRE